MKTKLGLALVTGALLMNGGLSLTGQPHFSWWGGTVAQAQARVDFRFFYDELAPYGNWRQREPYGWVWYPGVERRWRPYTVGSWVFTDDYGWTWITADPWGSVPFHYGRWFYDDDRGRWAWVPGTEWGPAWVGWRSGNGYIGWAPLPPSVEFNGSVGFAPSDQNFGASWNSWNFVPARRFLNRRLEEVVVPRPRNTDLISSTVNVTNYTVNNRRVVNRSIDVDRLEGETRKRVVRYQVDEIDRPMRRERPIREGRVVLFRPQVVRSEVAPWSSTDQPRRWNNDRPEDRFERRGAAEGTRERRMDDREPQWRERPERTEAGGQSLRQEPHWVDFQDRDGQRPRQQMTEGQRREPERERVEQRPERVQRQQVNQPANQQRGEQERNQQQMEREQARQQEQVRQRAEQERAQRQAEQEQARQQAAQQRQQAQQEQARQRAEQERAQRQAEQEQARQQAAQQRQQAQQEQARQRAEQERAQRQAEQEQARQQAQQEQARQRAEQERAQRQAERQAQRQAEQAQRQAERQTERQAERQTEQAQRQAERQAQRQAERQARRQAEQAQRQAEREEGSSPVAPQQ